MKKETRDMGVNNRKGIGKSEAWEIDVGNTAFPKAEFEGPQSAWLAKRPSMRPTPHNKVNECDH